MKLHEGFVTHNTADEHILVSTGANGFSGLIRLNGTAAFIVEHLRDETTEAALVDALLAEYDVDRETAEKGVGAVLTKLRSVGAVTE